VNRRYMETSRSSMARLSVRAEHVMAVAVVVRGDLRVGAADAAGPDSDQHLARAGLGHRDLRHLQATGATRWPAALLAEVRHWKS